MERQTQPASRLEYEGCAPTKTATTLCRTIGKLACFGPSLGERIVSGSDDKTIKIWDASTGAELMTLRGHSGKAWSVAFSPDGKRIVSGSSDRTVKLWDAANGKEVMTLRGHSDHVFGVAFSPDGKRIVSGSRDTFPKKQDSPGNCKTKKRPRVNRTALMSSSFYWVCQDASLRRLSSSDRIAPSRAGHFCLSLI